MLDPVSSRVLVRGEMVPDEGYDRGPMVLHPEEEWRRRSDLLRRHHVRFQVMVAGTFLLMPAAVVAEMVVVPKARDDPLLIELLIVFVIMVTILILFSRTILRDFDRGPLRGLYERGLQWHHEDFIPYEEIERVYRDGRGLMLTLRGAQEGSSFEWGPWTRSEVILGKEGIAELERRVRA